MDNSPFAKLLSKNRVILADGAMGTMLQRAGLESGACPDLWNADEPDKVVAIQRAYVEAGARIILTNTFGATRFRLARYGLKDRVQELNRAGAHLARRATKGTDALVAGDVGPSGELLAPLGPLSFDEAVEGFAEQAAGLAEGGVDYFQIETMADLEEVRAAIEGIRRTSALPIAATLTFDTHGRTMMGVKPEKAANTLLGWGVFAIGGNCGNGPDEIEGVVSAMREVSPEAPIIAKANAGLPEYEAGEIVYRGTPAVMAEYALRVRELGATVIGGCCGTTPDHIAAMAEALGLADP